MAPTTADPRETIFYFGFFKGGRVGPVLTGYGLVTLKAQKSVTSQITGYALVIGLSEFFNNSIGFRLAIADALEHAQVDQDVNQRILVGDGRPVAQIRPFDAQRFGLAVDALGG